MFDTRLVALFVVATTAGGCDLVFGVDPPEGTGGACPSGFETSKHQLFAGAKDWTTAEAACVALTTKDEGMFTHLAVAETQQEWIDLAQLGAGLDIWVGASDRKVEGTFTWVTDQVGEPIPWGPSEPDGGDSADCVKISGKTLPRPDDAACTELHVYICECDANTEVSTTF